MSFWSSLRRTLNFPASFGSRLGLCLGGDQAAFYGLFSYFSSSFSPARWRGPISGFSAYRWAVNFPGHCQAQHLLTGPDIRQPGAACCAGSNGRLVQPDHLWRKLAQMQRGACRASPHCQSNKVRPGRLLPGDHTLTISTLPWELSDGHTLGGAV